MRSLMIGIVAISIAIIVFIVTGAIVIIIIVRRKERSSLSEWISWKRR